MPGLYLSLSMAARSLEAQRVGLDIAGQNIANLNTPGYARRRVELAEVVNSTGGVEVLGTRALRDAVLDARARNALPVEAREGALAGALALVETTIGPPGQGLDGRLAAFFDAWSALSADPSSPVARDTVVLQGRQLAASFNDIAARLADSARLADNGIRGAVGEVNTLTAQIASLNEAIAVAGAAELARLTGATLHVATVGGATTSAMLGDPLAGAAAMSVAAEETRDELNDIVERAADPARAEGITVCTHTLIGSAAQALCDLAESVGADLIVVGNRGMQGGRRFLGSVPNTISHHAPCSVLIYETQHPHDA